MDAELTKTLVKLAVIAVSVIAGYFLIRSLMRGFLTGMNRMGENLIRKFFKGLSQIETADEERPKSLPNMESMILPQILKDFPDFDLAMTKNQVGDHLKSVYSARPGFMIHDIRLTEYRRRSVKKVVVFQAAVCWRGQKLMQKKLEVALEFQCIRGKSNPAINCPNCGATLGFGDLECKYCGTRINDRRDQEWSFTSIREI